MVRHNLDVLGIAAVPVGFDVLIGRDMLAECLFLVYGRAGTFTLAF